MRRFVQYHDKWYLEITSKDDIEWARKYFLAKTVKAIKQFESNKEHITSRLQRWIFQIGSSNVPSALDALMRQIESLIETKPVYVSDDLSVTLDIKPEGTKLSDDFPAPKIALVKWPGGNHWYAKVDGEDVVIDGVQKWPTMDAAYKAALKYMEEK